jgi:hypothetical protein
MNESLAKFQSDWTLTICAETESALTQTIWKQFRAKKICCAEKRSMPQTLQKLTA